MEGGMIGLRSLSMQVPLKGTGKMKKPGTSKKRSSIVNPKVVNGTTKLYGEVALVMPRHMRLALASYKTSSDANVSEDTYCNVNYIGVKKRTRSLPHDFWSRVDSGEIKVQPTIDDWCQNMEPPKTSKIEFNIPNYAISTTNMADYSYKSTAFGDVYYSPRFCDTKYIYRFVILTKGVRNEAYRILKSCGRYFLSESQIIHQLGIDLSPGWEHFMVFRSKLDELILRRPIGT